MKTQHFITAKMKRFFIFRGEKHISPSVDCYYFVNSIFHIPSEIFLRIEVYIYI